MSARRTTVAVHYSPTDWFANEVLARCDKSGAYIERLPQSLNGDSMATIDRSDRVIAVGGSADVAILVTIGYALGAGKKVIVFSEVPSVIEAAQAAQIRLLDRHVSVLDSEAFRLALETEEEDTGLESKGYFASILRAITAKPHQDTRESSIIEKLYSAWSEDDKINVTQRLSSAGRHYNTWFEFKYSKHSDRKVGVDAVIEAAQLARIHHRESAWIFSNSDFTNAARYVAMTASPQVRLFGKTELASFAKGMDAWYSRTPALDRATPQRYELRQIPKDIAPRNPSPLGAWDQIKSNNVVVLAMSLDGERPVVDLVRRLEEAGHRAWHNIKNIDLGYSCRQFSDVTKAAATSDVYLLYCTHTTGKDQSWQIGLQILASEFAKAEGKTVVIIAPSPEAKRRLPTCFWHSPVVSNWQELFPKDNDSVGND